MKNAICIIPNCGRSAPAAEPFCSKHRDKPTFAPAGHEMRPYAFCCNGDPSTCDCVNPEHGDAFFEKRDSHVPQIIADKRRIEALEAAVTKARDVFKHYGDLHNKKGHAEGSQKAAVNWAYAMEMDEALENKP